MVNSVLVNGLQMQSYDHVLAYDVVLSYSYITICLVIFQWMVSSPHPMSVSLHR